MARKNNGITGMTFQQIMTQQAFNAADKPVYCRFCGQDVKVPGKNSSGGANGGWRRYLDWEMENESHVNCANAHKRKK